MKRKEKPRPSVRINVRVPAAIIDAVAAARGEEPFSRFTARALATQAGNPELADDLPGPGKPPKRD